MVLFQKSNSNKMIKQTDMISITLYIALQGLVWGFGFYLIGMYLGWFLWMVIAKRVKNYIIEVQALAGFLFAFIYGLSFYPLTGIIYQIPFTTYIIADFPFALIMGGVNFLTILWLRDIIYTSISYENRL